MVALLKCLLEVTRKLLLQVVSLQVGLVLVAMVPPTMTVRLMERALFTLEVMLFLVEMEAPI